MDGLGFARRGDGVRAWWDGKGARSLRGKAPCVRGQNDVTAGNNGLLPYQEADGRRSYG